MWRGTSTSHRVHELLTAQRDLGLALQNAITSSTAPSTFTDARSSSRRKDMDAPGQTGMDEKNAKTGGIASVKCRSCHSSSASKCNACSSCSTADDECTDAENDDNLAVPTPAELATIARWPTYTDSQTNCTSICTSPVYMSIFVALIIMILFHQYYWRHPDVYGLDEVNVNGASLKDAWVQWTFNLTNIGTFAVFAITAFGLTLQLSGQATLGVLGNQAGLEIFDAAQFPYLVSFEKEIHPCERLWQRIPDPRYVIIPAAPPVVPVALPVLTDLQRKVYMEALACDVRVRLIEEQLDYTSTPPPNFVQRQQSQFGSKTLRRYWRHKKAFYTKATQQYINQFIIPFSDAAASNRPVCYPPWQKVPWGYCYSVARQYMSSTSVIILLISVALFSLFTRYMATHPRSFTKQGLDSSVYDWWDIYSQMALGLFQIGALLYVAYGFVINAQTVLTNSQTANFQQFASALAVAYPWGIPLVKCIYAGIPAVDALEAPVPASDVDHLIQTYTTTVLSLAVLLFIQLEVYIRPLPNPGFLNRIRHAMLYPVLREYYERTQGQWTQEMNIWMHRHVFNEVNYIVPRPPLAGKTERAVYVTICVVLFVMFVLLLLM